MAPLFHRFPSQKCVGLPIIKFMWRPRDVACCWRNPLSTNYQCQILLEQSVTSICNSYHTNQIIGMIRRNIYIISEETSIFAPQRLPFYMALGDAACTVGKVRASTVFMCVCSTFRSSDFFTISKKRIRRGSTYAECTSRSLKERRLQLWLPHCLTAARRLALNKRGLLNTACQPHTLCTLNWVR